MAVERLKTCNNIVALSKELGVHRRMLYKWRGSWLGSIDLRQQAMVEASGGGDLNERMKKLEDDRMIVVTKADRGRGLH